MLCEYYNRMQAEGVSDMPVKNIYEKIEMARIRARTTVTRTDKAHVLFAIKLHDENGQLVSVQIHRNACLSDEELDDLIRKYPYSIFDVFHTGTCKKGCTVMIEKEKSREIRPITLKEANAFVNEHHRHHNGTVGCKFALGLYEEDRLIGVAICGRPVSRYLDKGLTCEINRLCTIGDNNACSQLYGACAWVAKDMGYKKIITYILKSENGSSLKASGFVCEGEAGGTHWTGERDRGQQLPNEMKKRWAIEF